MYLKNLTLKGFKSFAGATAIALEPGVTCVVGPNGSGKSNVVDALAWVMGEQGAKTLRGAQMSDVVFAGTASRAPLGRAEVSLTIDNSDSLLPIDYTEVTISRTMFRTGGSEYAINGSPVRLLDVQELLSDVGMGRQMHVIVGQGQLDEVLGASDLERRGFIEEAAGILKHRQRKDKALRKLDSLALKLTRIQDLTNEVGKQLKPLARQADAARKAQVIQAVQRECELRLLADELSELSEKNVTQQASAIEIENRLGAVKENIAALSQELKTVQSQVDGVSPQLEELTQYWGRLTTIREKIISLADRAAERAKMLTAVEDNTGVDTQGLQQRLHKAQEEEKEVSAELEECEIKLLATQKILKERETAQEAVRARITALARAQSDRRELLERLRGNANNASRMLEESHDRLNLSQMQCLELEAKAQGAIAAQEAMPREENLEADIGQSYREATLLLEDITQELNDILEQQTQVRAELASWQGRAKALESTLAPSDISASIIDAKVEGLLGTLPETIRVKSQWAQAIEAIFGQWASSPVVRSVAQARAAIDLVRKNSDGIARIIVTGKVGDEQLSVCDNNLPEGCFWASELITPVGESLGIDLYKKLQEIAVCPDLASGQKLLETQVAKQVVTKAGDYLSSTLVLGAGRSNNSVLGQQADFEEALAETQAGMEKLEAISLKVEKLRARQEEARNNANEALAELRKRDAHQAEINAQIAAVAAAAKAAQSEAKRAREAYERAEKEFEERKLKAQQAQKDFEEMLGEETTQDESQELKEELSQAIELVNNVREDLTGIQMRYSSLRERSASMISRIESLQRNLAQEKRRAVEQEIAKKRAVRSEKIAKHVVQQAQKAALVAGAALDLAQSKRVAAQNSDKELKERLFSLRQSLEQAQSQRSELMDVSSRDQLAVAETQMYLNARKDEAQKRFGMQIDQIISEFGPLVPIAVFNDKGEVTGTKAYSRSQVSLELDKANKELERLGKVNPLALTEHESLAARHQFLASQLADIKTSRQDLLKIIEEIDRQVVEVFSQAYLDVKEQFHSIFSTLFPGGQGKLVLTQPDNMLETGIEIEACPAGKKVKRLSLLSGGERSLAALAFLIAIFKARPSPFYVLDEVEAALDDANLGRLLLVFNQLKEDSQLIIITHQKRTMEIADALYGVTMRSGVTTVVSQRLSDNQMV